MNKLSKFMKRVQFRNRQRAINKQYEREGLTDEVLDAQVALNIERHEHDISDETKRVHDKYVQ
ncbi:hypothetical protein [uncultured Methanobrevibacter sp.]|uniref:hypothetical protein n=1 Tax=uncultured Methanobrevibacter sp. TaxID=253161 RepID=UPI0025CEBC4E|nr:hypothetical protein [uncultured Methanobrevibacter sp.]